MKTTRWVVAAIVCAVLVPLPHSAAPTIDDELSAFVQRGDIPGGVVAIAATSDRVIYQAAFGKADDAANRPMTLDALFRIASMTKAVTSVAAMQLFEQHRFALDDPAEKYLPELAGLSVIDTFDATTGAYTIHRARRPVTIRQLFTHTSGF